MNAMRTGLLMAAMTGLFLAIGYLLGGANGMAIAFLLALATNLFAYWNSDRMVLAMYGAEPVGRERAPELYGIVEQLAINAGLPMPKICILQSDQPNAFATGRDPEHAAVVVTTGLTERMTSEELAGVLAHELAHVKNRDTLTMTVTATLAGAISMLAHFAFFFGGSRDRKNPLGGVGAILIMVLAPLAAMAVQLAISRTREYEADRIGAEISAHPLWLASALGKLGRAAREIENRAAEANPATAHLFIVNPLRGQGMDNLFATHPSLENRIARLEAMARRHA